MTDPRDMLAKYLRQRQEMGEPPLVLDRWEDLRQLGSASEEKRPSPAAPDGGHAPTPPAGRQLAEPKAARRSGHNAADPAARQPTTSETKKAGPQPSGRNWRRGAPPIPPAGIVVEAPPTDLFSADPLAGKDLDAIAQVIRQCTKCPLCRERTNAVPGEGPRNAPLVVVGEGPGATEDETGRPFVGRAGQLLTEILASIELPREQVYICNVVKCRPPANRKPQQDEIEACLPYLHRQLDRIRPKVILAMGNTAAETLLNTKQALGSLRGRVHQFRGVPVVVTYHPAALLRNPHWKKPTWDDVRIARQLVDA